MNPRPWMLLIILASPIGCVGNAAVATSESQALSVCAGSATVAGVDVSKYQATVDFTQVKQSGRGFAIARTGDGTTTDATFASNWSAMQAAGLYRGAYHFFRASSDPIVQADKFLSAIGPLGPGDLPPALDLEVTDGATAAVVVTRAQQWLARVAQVTGRKPMIYSSTGFWSQIGDPDLSAYVLWVANWQVTCPSVPAGWSDWTIWQSSDSGSVPGIRGVVDLDTFNGSQAELDVLAGITGTMPGPIDGGSADGALAQDAASEPAQAQAGGCAITAGAATPAGVPIGGLLLILAVLLRSAARPAGRGLSRRRRRPGR